MTRGQSEGTSKASIQIMISSVCDEIKTMLLTKNERYGNSALDPVRIFSKADSREQLYVRIDDNLSRIQKGAGLLGNDEDVINDLIGYLVLLKVNESLAANLNNSWEYSYENLGNLDAGAFIPEDPDYYDKYVQSLDDANYFASYRA